MRVGVHPGLGLRDADAGHQLDGLALGLLGAHAVVDPERFGQLGSHGVERVERGQRVLEDDREFGACDLAALPAVGAEQVDAAERGGALDDVGDGLEQADERGGGHRLAAAGFAEQGEGFAAAGLEADLVDGAHGAGDGADLDAHAVDVEHGLGVGLVDGGLVVYWQRS